jgi:hypothetical protein
MRLLDLKILYMYAEFMPGGNFKLCLLAAVVLAVSCASNTSQQNEKSADSSQEQILTTRSTVSPEETSGINAVSARTNTEKDTFDPSSITPELYRETKEDIGKFISNLNMIIRAKMYNEWLAYLDEEYYNFINSPEYLRDMSNAGILQARRIVLTNAHDYFMNVVVPSRSNDRVDDIEFISENRVKAITMERGRRIILYELEKRNNVWKIIMPNSKRL